jgi:hypothetical protein
MKFEVRSIIRREHRGQHDAAASGGGQPVDGKGQDIGALREADEKRALLSPVIGVVAQDPIDVGGQPLRSALRPEITP